MALRTTRQTVDVLGVADSQLRATRQTVDVLGVIDTSLRVTHQSIEYLVEYAEVYVDSSVSFDHVVSVQTVRVRSVESNRNFFQFIIAGGVTYTDEVAHLLTNDVYKYNPNTGEYYYVHYGLHQDIGLQVVGIRETIQDFNINQTIEYVHIKAAAIVDGETSTLALSQTIEDSRGMASDISFTQTISATTNYGRADTLSLAQTIEVAQFLNPPISNSLDLQSIVNYTLNESSKNVLCTYSPFVGETADPNAPAPPLTTAPTIVALKEITLHCPIVPSTITLRNPELGDVDSSGFQRVQRESRGGTLIVFADPVWPRTRKLILEFIGLNEAKAQEFLTFLNLSLGQYVELTDWESNTWGGIITAPQNPIIRNGRDNISATVEFECGRFFGESVEHTLVQLSQTVVAGIFGRIFVDTLVFGQVIDPSVSTYNRTVTSTLVFNQPIGLIVSTDTPWTGSNTDKLYLVSGQFTSVIKDSEYIGAIDTVPWGISWDGINTPWCGNDDKLYLQSGQFTSTLKASENVSDIYPTGISWDGTNTPWTGSGDNKLFLQSGQFTSTISTSRSVNSIDSQPQGLAWDGTDTPWIGAEEDKLYLQSGQFDSVIKTSLSVESIDEQTRDIGWDGTNTIWCGTTGNKLYLQSGEFSSVMKTSEDISAIDSDPLGVDTNKIRGRTRIFRYSESSDIVFSQIIGKDMTLGRTDTSTLTLGQDIDPSGSTYNRALISTLTLGQSLTSSITAFSVVDTLTCSQDIDLDTILGRTVTSTLSFGQDIDEAATFTLWIGSSADRLYLQSGQFTSTLRDSLGIAGKEGGPSGVDWDGTNVVWTGSVSTDALFLYSGLFTSTVKDSEAVGGIDDIPTGIGVSGANTPWAGSEADKLYLQSGRFTSTLNTSVAASATVSGVSWDGTDTPWCQITPSTLFLYSGQFTTTIKDSEDVSGVDTSVRGLAWNRVDTPFVGNTDNKLYLQSGQFTSTLKNSEDISSIESTPQDISVNQYY